mmetsp:Transcript_30552/g.27764  ORF Transcript_30552/g.27764 Transcript_30552/m.27764 type:complete len:120 (+) Transcript_30552:381-740(+)|eukprot:CAMPEP_0114591636 /NCGR_PEP_ID=MMETSP0125-20121206/13633_1 /TAXON_ID=485358 ORGANISM="Aristerostoma sp., Strain ATCC 50986" /NCGR_SAMPLE_ID=MMETSP0125 /ASSEMBLY_ACC=CAM_ASM_000245 /LENGTH=119 /DNA_ID=CAMNT_0001789819 /DNA_START=476 /DNA_END=835 /DNA_ORIENTATION=-
MVSLRIREPENHQLSVATPGNNSLGNIISPNTIGTNENNEDSLSEETEDLKSVTGKPTRRRNQERKVGEVLDLIQKWRSYYDGTQSPSSQKVGKFSLTDAATKVGVPKKSLDDYLMVIK